MAAFSRVPRRRSEKQLRILPLQRRQLNVLVVFLSLDEILLDELHVELVLGPAVALVAASAAVWWKRAEHGAPFRSRRRFVLGVGNVFVVELVRTQAEGFRRTAGVYHAAPKLRLG